MDVTKTRLQVLSQVKTGPKPSLAGVMKDIIAKDGVTGLYAGCVEDRVASGASAERRSARPTRIPVLTTVVAPAPPAPAAAGSRRR